MLNKSMFRKPKNMLEFRMEHENQAPYVPDDMYIKCQTCKAMLLTNELKKNMFVCMNCGSHFRVNARKRIKYIFDSFEETDAEFTSVNILNFPGYEEKLKKAKKESGEKEGVITGTGMLNGIKTAAFIMEPGFMMGSMGSVVGEKITRIFEYAVKNRLPVIGFTVSGGARMHEGIISLMQMAKTSGAVKRHSEEGLLYIVVLTDPTTGGVTASFAMEGDIIIAEPKALIGFAGPRVIEQTIRQRLPQGFQSAEFLLEKGFIDLIVSRTEMKEKLGELLKIHERN